MTLAGALIAGCGSTTSSSNAKGDASIDAPTEAGADLDAMAPDAASIPLSDFPVQAADELCTAFAACCAASGYVNDEGACAVHYGQGLQTAAADATSKGYSYDGAAAASCYAGLAKQLNACAATYSARGLDAAFAPCLRIFHGSIALGGDCSVSNDCASPADGSNVVCVSFSSGGGPYVCALSGTGVAGDPCGDAIGSSLTCAPGFYCKYTTSLTCAAVGGNGASCDPTLRSSDCAEGFYCGPSHVCAKPSAVGAACDPTLSRSCGSTNACDATTKVCVAPGALGKPCAGGWACASGTYCDYLATNTCLALKARGAACDSSTECVSGKCAKQGTETNGECGTSGAGIVTPYACSTGML
jgi:hypothetical protein